MHLARAWWGGKHLDISFCVFTEPGVKRYGDSLRVHGLFHLGAFLPSLDRRSRIV
jgi:hypothetical protein